MRPGACLAAMLPIVAVVGLAAPQTAQPSGGDVVGERQAQLPSFRAGVDVVQFDVTVLDKDRVPVRGLTAADFSVLEDGRPQPIVGFAAVDLPDRDRSSAPWTSEVGSDVSTNRLDAKRVVVILLDDFHTPFDPAVVQTATATAETIVDQLGPDDLAAVVYTHTRRKGQEFTADHDRLRAAINRFASSQSFLGGPTGACPRARCVTDALRNAANSLEEWRGARKALAYIGPGFGFRFTQEELASSLVFGQMSDLQQTFAALQRVNMNIYAFDPRGLFVGLDVGAQSRRPMSLPSNTQDMLRIFAENTGGRATVNTNSPADDVPQMFRENSSYYILSFQSDNSKPERRFRQVSVRVNRPNADVRTRAGYFPPTAKKPANRPQTALAKAASGALPATDVPLMVTVAPFAVPGGKTPLVVIVAGMKRSSESVGNVVELAATAFRDDWKEQGTAKQRIELDGQNTAAHYDIGSTLALRPGRYEIRVAAERQSDHRTGSAYASVVVPDFANAPLSLSGLVLDYEAAGAAKAQAAIAGLLPVAPTTVREFSATDRVAAFLRIYQGGKKPIVPVRVSNQIIDATGRAVLAESSLLGQDAFGSARSHDHRLELSLGRLTPGQYLLSIGASAGTITVDRKVRFAVR